MFSRKIRLFVAGLAVAFVLGTGGGGLLADAFGFEVTPAAYARGTGCGTGGGC